MPGSGAEDADVERNSRGARNTGGGIERSLARRVSERDEDVAVQVEGRAPVVEPEMRGPMTRPSHRQVLADRVSGARRGSVIGCDDSRLEDVSQHEPVDRVRRSRGAQARVGAGDRVRAALWLVGSPLQRKGGQGTGERALEVGCGAGALTAASALAPYITGIDRDEPSIEPSRAGVLVRLPGLE